MNPTDREDQLNDWLCRHKGVLVKVVRSFARSAHDRDDLFQEIAFQVWTSIPRYISEVAETTWLYRVALYTAIDWSRKEEVRARKQGEYGLWKAVALAETETSDPRLEWLYECIGQLEAVDRSLALLMLDGFSYREMAKTLGMTESNVGVRINRIKKRLTQQLEQSRGREAERRCRGGEKQ